MRTQLGDEAISSDDRAVNQEQWLTQYIELCFADVTLGPGRDLYAAQSAADYGNPAEDRLSLGAERLDWRRIPAGDLFARWEAVTFLDPEGFRFYAPAITTALIVDPGRKATMLQMRFLFNLKITTKGKIKSVPFSTPFTDRHRAALIRFLKYLVHNCKGEPSEDAVRVLKEFQTRTRI